MASCNFFNAFKENGVETCNLGSDVFKVALCAAANAPVATNSVLADLTTVSTANTDSVTLTTSSSAQTSGTYKLIIADKVITATGAVGAFRYVVIYDDTPTSPADPLVCWYDYGSEISLSTGETLTLDFDPTNGLLSLT
jgi:hypothetical protein